MDRADHIIARYDKLKGERGTWENHWQEIAERVLPRYSDSFISPASMLTKGEKKTEKMFDSTAAIALERFAAAMESMLTPRNSTWHRLSSSNPFLNRDRETELWFAEATRILFSRRYAPEANYASQQHEVYMGLGAFGTGAMFIDRHDAGGLRYSSVNLADIIFAMNHQGVLDTSYRKFTQTARQMKQRLDSGRYKQIPEDAMKAVEKTPDKPFEVIHCVMPRDDMDPAKSDFRGMSFASFYVSMTDKMILSEGGFRQFPYAISRYVTAPGEVYGRSPAMISLPSIKVLNEQKKTMLKQGHRVVDPVLLAHDDGVLDTFSLKPGSVNVGGINAQGQRMVQELPTGNLAAGQELMDMERAVINDAFLVTLFQILVETPAMTATEVLERAREKGALLSPTMGRQQSEMLGPMIERELDLLVIQDMLPPLPPALVEAEGEFDIIYDSPLSRSQRAEEAAGWLRTFESAGAFASMTGDPSALDHFNTDIIIPELSKINAVPPSWMRGADGVAELREARAQQAQIQQAIEVAPAAAGMLKGVGGTNGGN
jgi:hypothetical protein|tara:strand:- start:8834 stop:10465 length:1632 start_codon:yes stop_codon:yes gene_type:complete